MISKVLAGLEAQEPKKQLKDSFSAGNSGWERCLSLCVRRAALNAARCHTLDATGVDSSSASAAFMKYDVSRNESWDMVILDPPKLAF
ncbi:hypothetical protein Tco_0822395 [Tanacetum coccineum]|uniref:Uncharacterized protein n=1 Tax=Tanacetum coccineum TaxID=301880 RepID=A0ABQ5AG01_9ASTR